MPREIGSREIGVVIHGLAGTLGDVVSAAGEDTLTSLGYVLGVPIEDFEPRQRDWWRRFEITSGSNPVVEHETLLGFLTAESPRGLTRFRGNPVRTLELLFALLDEAEDRALAGQIRAHLEAGGVTRDSVEQAAAKPRPRKGEVGRGRSSGATSIGRGKDYLAARLERDRPDLAAEVKAGRKKLRAAAREAGECQGRTNAPQKCRPNIPQGPRRSVAGGRLPWHRHEPRRGVAGQGLRRPAAALQGAPRGNGAGSVNPPRGRWWRPCAGVRDVAPVPA
jgi:hypothetical protein